jgi:prevent-host-death family protein
MTNVGVYETKTHLPKLLDRVAKGERITITRHGVPVAELVPVTRGRTMTPQAAAEIIRELRKGQRLDGLTVRELVEEGRR